MTATTVRVESDARTLLQALSKTFTRSTTVISELLQNARRAGATQVEITLADGDLVVADNGIGIQDASVLLAVAKSGWDEAVQASDAPYGIGFLSTLFCCEEVEVRSKGHCLKAATADLLAISPVALQPIDDDGLTRIRLGAHRLGALDKVVSDIKRLVAGFPLPVSLNGELLDRPHALTSREFIETPIGFATPGVQLARGVRQFYLQGLPIQAESRSLTCGYADRSEIVHLRSPLFEGRMPERDSLLEPEASAELIRIALRQVARAHLTTMASQMPEMAFVANHGCLAAALDMRDLLNGMSHIPRAWVYVYDETPRLEGACNSVRVRERANAAIARGELEAKGLFSIEIEEEGDDYTLNLIGRHFVSGIEGFVADGVPSWHWAHGLIQTVRPDDFVLVPGPALGEDTLEVFYETIALRVVETLGVQRMDAEGKPQGAIVPTTCHYAMADGVLYATPDADGGDTVAQVTDFEDDERYVESQAAAARERFYVTRRVLLNNDPAALLLAFLEAGLPYSTPEALRGKSFEVAVAPDGKATVTLAHAAADPVG